MASSTRESFSPSYENLLDFLHKAKGGIEKLPQVLFVVSEDSYEFGLVSDLYREAFRKSGDAFEVVVFVSEPGDLEAFQNEAMNLDMFAARKLFVIKSGTDFFKPLLGKGKSKLGVKTQFSSLPESVKVLVHYDHWDISKELISLFGQEAKYFKSGKIYPDKRRDAVLRACKEADVRLDDQAEEEFILRVNPSAGSYLKNLEKLRLYLGKKSFKLEDLKEVLFQSSEFSAPEILDFFFERDSLRFAKEFSKFKIGKDSLLLFLSLLKDHTDRLRKFKVISRHYENVLSEKEQSDLLEMQNYSPGRKSHMLRRLRKENSAFSDKDILELYEFITEINRKIKTGAEKEDTVYYFLRRVENFFRRQDRTVQIR
ncbi:putative DNA polymerase III, delta subunit [Leptospira fainei serovar Hurstbridge str. BUT 6]|uniref:DNA polymerase III, delta subunit n=1 Tax=Leptospira fainei serovar Hurstbridge str. BUT 6 TaxID=1193011 RepID=S3VB31_9LEPT|nr:DNA polymerase III, delta subunit [Leptospira fainei]EPG73670.1 putative DNA polymerase III, delta subunit [Leptospira fainei serovar Hurstbridge str. BUT 6]